ncbi:MAG TPA: AraC family transcriptional regulator [Arachidicoccus sp.]
MSFSQKESNIIYVKNMVCSRCKMVVKSEFEKLGIQPLSVELGEISLKEKLSEDQFAQLSNKLSSFGFEIINTRKARIIEKIKNLIIGLVHHSKDILNINLSDYLCGELHLEYHYLSTLFSTVEGITIEQYFIAQKIERVKELLMYDELSLTEIAYQLGYSSTSHLSNQFKKQTGLTPSFFKTERQNKRQNLEDL